MLIQTRTRRGCARRTMYRRKISLGQNSYSTPKVYFLPE